MNIVVLTPYEQRIFKRAVKARDADGFFKLASLVNKDEDRRTVHRAVAKLKTLAFVESVPEVAGRARTGVYVVTKAGADAAEKAGL